MANANDELLYVTNQANILFCFNVSEDNVQYFNALWSHAFNTPLESGIAMASGHVFICDRNGNVICMPMILSSDNTSLALIIVGVTVGVAVGLMGVAIVVEKRHPKRNP